MSARTEKMGARRVELRASTLSGCFCQLDEDMKLQRKTPTSIIIEPARPVRSAPARFALSPRFSMNWITGALISQAKKPSA